MLQSGQVSEVNGGTDSEGSSPSRYPYILSGKINCSICSNALNGKSAHGNGGKIGYYEHGWATKRMGYMVKDVFHCDPHRILAKIIEPRVWDEVMAIMADSRLIQDLVAEAHSVHSRKSADTELNGIKRRIQSLDLQLESLAGRIASLPVDVPADPFYKQMQRLESVRKEAQKELSELQTASTSSEMPAQLQSYSGLAAAVRKLGGSIGNAPDPDQAELREICRRIIQHVVHKIEVTPKSFRIFFYCGEKNIQFAKEQLAGKSVIKKDKPDDTFSASSGSNLLTNGWADWD